ncbi:MAG: N-acetylmuramic acid 6-phosphate etherase [Oscillospiraceae bacterium]|nr:N-acetylmuramic acid 6-phosphate etherase [Oscillospiraceae bacterium]
MESVYEINSLPTEQPNPLTAQIDTLSTLEMVELINREDQKVAPAVAAVTGQIAAAIDLITDRLSNGGRLIYIGCGTSGRLGILDAVECPPTFSTDPQLVQGLIAGGREAIFRAVEGAEDDPRLACSDLEAISFNSSDVLVGIAASGRTPYVLGAMGYAREKGAAIIGVTCAPGSPIDHAADIGIAPTPGPEVIAGSTRMKSGTAQKMVLNMLSTGAMIRLGKVYGNRMVDVKPSNQKLIRRCIRIVCEAAGAPEDEAVAALEACSYRCKQAIVMLLLQLDADAAALVLANAKGRVAEALATGAEPC